MVARMTSSERMAALMSGQKPDRIPVIPFIEGILQKLRYISWRFLCGRGQMF